MRAMLDLPAPHTKALELLMERIPPDEVFWVLTGSGGLRLQGVDVEVHDLDIQSDESGVYEIARRMERFVEQQPRMQEGKRLRSHLGALRVWGVQLELIGDIQHRKPDGAWDEPVNLLSIRRWIAWKTRSVPVLDLAYEARAYRLLGRQSKVEAIDTVIARSKGDGDA